MTWKRCAVAGLFLGLICTGMVIAAMLQEQRQGVTKANFSRIEKGMSKKQVQEILGEKSFCGFMVGGGAGGISQETWSREDGATAEIGFFYHYGKGDGHLTYEVSDMKWVDSTETIYQTVRRWLHFR